MIRNVPGGMDIAPDWIAVVRSSRPETFCDPMATPLKLGLALSGGGFRATLFHLGMIRFLRDAELLQKVELIVSVSGGSILAAHLALNWDRYVGSKKEFDAAAAQIIDFVQLDVRNRIMRRLPLLYPLRVLEHLIRRGDSRRFISSGILERLYDKHLYAGKCVNDLPNCPELHILATNVSEGCLCSFSRHGLLMKIRGSKPALLPARLTRVSLAVAASSAFPGFFPPVRMSADEVGLQTGEFPTQSFTDGGVFDNLGVRAFDLLHESAPPVNEILVSDVGKTFRILPKTQLGLIRETMRATDVLYDRVWQLEKAHFETDGRFLFVPAVQSVEPKDDPTALSTMIQPEIANIRTDLDRFSPLEIKLLVQHGYCVARAQCRSKPESFGSNLPCTPPWDPFAVDAMAGPAPALQSLLAQDDATIARKVRLSAERRISALIDFRDWATYVYLPLIALLFIVLPLKAWSFVQRAKSDASVVNAVTQNEPDLRKILEVVRSDPPRDWPAQVVQEQVEPTPIKTEGFEFLSDTYIVDLRQWRPKNRDKAYYYRRIRARKLSDDNRLVVQYVQPFKDINFRCGPEKLKPVVRRIKAQPGEREVMWEIEFDFSSVPRGRITEVTIEANLQDVAASTGLTEKWVRYQPQFKTDDASVWLLFPKDQPYENFTLSSYPIERPEDARPVDTRYAINHPQGSILAWVVANPEVGYVYECQWTLQD
jgi:predicted acylesterase/phospholipase RssA